MIRVDLSKSNKVLSNMIADLCAPYGKVKSVNIYRSPTPYAVVQMDDRKKAVLMARKLGKLGFDGAALIPLKRK
jgi:hypothetical protein